MVDKANWSEESRRAFLAAQNIQKLEAEMTEMFQLMIDSLPDWPPGMQDRVNDLTRRVEAATADAWYWTEQINKRLP